MAQQVRCLLYTLEDRSSDPRTHIILAFRGLETEGSLGLASCQPGKCKFQVTGKSLLQRNKEKVIVAHPLLVSAPENREAGRKGGREEGGRGREEGKKK